MEFPVISVFHVILIVETFK